MKNIIALVHSLSPTEKQHFKKRHKPNADFVLLFDYINKRKSCTNKDAMAHMNKIQGRDKKITSKYLSVVKAYLKSRILESLRIQFINKRKNYEMLSRSMNADILLEKGLYSLAKDELVISNDKNMDSSFPIERLLLLRRKSILDYFENYSNTNLKNIELLFNSRLDAAEQLILEIKFARILSILSYQYFNGLNDTEILRLFMNEPYMLDESLSTDFSTKYLFHWVHAQFQEFKNNHEKAQEHFNKSIKIWLDNPKYIHAHPRMYLGACFTYFKYLIHQKDPFSNILSDINFDVLISKVDTEELSVEEAYRHRFLFNLFEIISLRQQSKFMEIIHFVNPLLEDVNYINEVPNYEKVIFCYYAALANFDAGNFEKTQDILFDFLNPMDKRLGSNPLYFSVFILLQILVLLERNHVKHLRQLLPKYKRYLNDEDRLLQFESQFINMTSQLISTRFKSTPELVYMRFYNRLIEVQKNEKRGIEIEFNYFVSWIKKKEEALLN